MPGPQREGDSPFIFGIVERGLALPRGVEDAAPYSRGEIYPSREGKNLPYKSPIKIPFANSIAHRRELW